MGADSVSLARPPGVLEIVPGGAGLPDAPGHPDADLALTILYQQHAVGLIRLAFVMLGDRPAAEDVVQEAFCGLYRRWSHLSDPAKSLPYVRSAVLNGCRSVLRQRSRRDGRVTSEPPAASALSADGRKLAVALSPPGQLVVRVTDLVTYATRTWQGKTWTGSWPGGQSDLANEPALITLSWAADNRTLAMNWPGPVTLQAGFSQPLLTGVSLLNTAAGGTDLAADSSAVTPPGYLIGFTGNAMLTPDGSTIVSSGLLPTGPAGKKALDWNAALEQYSSSSGAMRWQPHIPHWQIEDPVPRVLWTNGTGSVMIISTSVFKNPARSISTHGTTVVGVLTKDKFTLLPGLRAPIAAVNTNPAGIAW